MSFWNFHNIRLVRYRVIKILDHLDTQVEKLRKDAVGLAEKRDILHMSMEIIRNNDLMITLNECKYIFGTT